MRRIIILVIMMNLLFSTTFIGLAKGASSIILSKDSGDQLPIITVTDDKNLIDSDKKVVDTVESKTQNQDIIVSEKTNKNTIAGESNDYASKITKEIDFINGDDTDSSGGGSVDVPDFLKEGDLFFMDTKSDCIWARPGYSNDHVAIYIGDNNFINALGPEGVQINPYSYFSSWAFNFSFAYVLDDNGIEVTPAVKGAAVEWAKERLGSKYQIFWMPLHFGLKIADPNNNHPSAKKWYCMELAWAAYYNQGIDIDSNGGIAVWGDDIRGDTNINFYDDIPPENDMDTKTNKTVYSTYSNEYIQNNLQKYSYNNFNVLAKPLSYRLFS